MSPFILLTRQRACLEVGVFGAVWTGACVLVCRLPLQPRGFRTSALDGEAGVLEA